MKSIARTTPTVSMVPRSTAPDASVGGFRQLHRPEARTGLLLVALPLLLFTFMPRPPIPAAHLLVYPSATLILSVFVVLLLRGDQTLDRRVGLVLFLLLLVNAVAAVSFSLNALAIRSTALLELLRPVVFAVFLVYAYLVARTYDGGSLRRGLLFAAIVILLGQTVIVATQLLGLGIFDSLYSAEKTRPFGSLVRATGSMANPNVFGWVVAQASVIAFLCASRSRWLWLGLGALLILLSGSRTLLLLFPFMVALTLVWRDETAGWTRLAVGATLAALAMVLTVWFVLRASAYLPYLGQLRELLVVGSLESVPSIAKRLEHWQTTFGEFSRGGWQAMLFGLGSRQSLRVLDNDYLYVLFRLGTLGLLLHLALIVYLARLFRSAPRDPATVVGRQYLVSSLVLGFVFETLGGWFFPLLLYFFLGLSMGSGRRVRFVNSRVDAGTAPPVLASV